MCLTLQAKRQWYFECVEVVGESKARVIGIKSSLVSAQIFRLSNHLVLITGNQYSISQAPSNSFSTCNCAVVVTTPSVNTHTETQPRFKGSLAMTVA